MSSSATASAAILSGLRRARSLLPSASDYGETRRSWPKDLVAGVTVSIVALPLALGLGVSLRSLVSTARIHLSRPVSSSARPTGPICPTR